MEYLCLYKEKWFLSFIIVSITLTIILNMLSISNNIQSQIHSVYLIFHIFIVSFYKNDACKYFKLNKQKEMCKNINNELELNK